MSLIEYDSNNAICNNINGAIFGTPIGGLPPFNYSWSNGAQSQELIDIGPGTYTLTVTDALGCTSTEQFVIVNENSFNFNHFGGDEGLEEGKYLVSGTEIDWSFIPFLVADQFEIISDVDGVLLNTGAITEASYCQCDGRDRCSCADYFLGDHGNEVLQLIVGQGTVTNAQGTCSNGVEPKEALTLYGTTTIPNDANVSFKINGSACGTTGTGWHISVSCGGNGSKIVPFDENFIHELGEVFEPESHLHKDEISKKIDEIAIYPNPASNSINLVRGKNVEEYNLRITDIHGRLVKELSNIKTSKLELDLSEMSSGLYFFEMFNDLMNKSEKVLIQK